MVLECFLALRRLGTRQGGDWLSSNSKTSTLTLNRSSAFSKSVKVMPEKS